MSLHRDGPRGRPQLLWMTFAAVTATACQPIEDARSGLLPVSLEVQFRIGEIDGDAALTDILGVAIGPDGHLYVTQWKVPHVTVFSGTGSVVRTIGRGGMGPGEFIQPGPLGFLGDSLWVSGQGGLAVFDLEGAVLRHMKFRRVLDGSSLSYSPGRLMSDGTLISNVLFNMSSVARGELTRVPILVTSEAGDILDTLAWTRVGDIAALRIDGGPMSLRVPELAGPGSVFAADGSAVVTLATTTSDSASSLEAVWLDPHGDTLSAWSDDAATEPFRPDVKELVVSRMVEVFCSRVSSPLKESGTRR